MIDLYLERLRRDLFRSNKEEWKSRDAWARRAVFWKMTALAYMQNNRHPDILKHHEMALNGDQLSAPNETNLKNICTWLQNYTVTQNTKNKIVIAKD